MLFTESIKIIAEILLCFLAVVGVAYLINDIIDSVRSRKKSSRLPVLLDCSRFDFADVECLIRDYCRLMSLGEVRAFLGNLVLLLPDDSLISGDEAEKLAERYQGVTLSFGENTEELTRRLLSEDIVD